MPSLDALLAAFVKPVATMAPPVWLSPDAVSVSLCPDAAVPHLFVAEYGKAIGAKAAALGDKFHCALHAGTDAWCVRNCCGDCLMGE